MINLEKFNQWLVLNYKRKTAFNYLNVMKEFFKYYSEFNQDNINLYLLSKVNKLKNSSFNNILIGLTSYSKFLNINIELPKFKKVEKGKARPYITEKELDNILLKCPLIFQEHLKIKLILQFMFYGALRPCEVVNLKREDFNFDKNEVQLKNTKTYLQRKILIGDEIFQNNLKFYFRQECEVTNAFNITKESLTYYFKTLRENLNLKKEFTPYIMRHSGSHYWLDKTSINHVKNLLGHARLETTAIYLNVSEEETLNELKRVTNKRK